MISSNRPCLWFIFWSSWSQEITTFRTYLSSPLIVSSDIRIDSMSPIDDIRFAFHYAGLFYEEIDLILAINIDLQILLWVWLCHNLV